jgi:hypothetical protein
MIATGVCKDEADAIEEALNNNVDKGPWIDLFVSLSPYLHGDTEMLIVCSHCLERN